MTDVLQQAKALIWQHNESGFIHRNATMLLPELVAECERLQQVNQQLDEQLSMKIKKEDLLPFLHEKDNEIASLRSELTRWQKIAFNEKAWSLFNEKRLGCRQDISFDAVADDFREQAARELGIDTSDHIRDTTKMMMMTAEQRAALEYAISSLEQCDSEPEDPVAVEILQSMLAQSRPAWEITEERIVLLKSIMSQYKPNCVIEYSIMPDEIEVIAKMLEEAK